MKKTLVSALTTALVVGAASTALAAANPFADVPADHWAYDAVSQLTADGVIEGYGDNTFKGEKNITRYEMAQMVAKAMAKTNVGSTDKALIDKLAAEFADELNNLGVRVANLEKNADKVAWHGLVRYDYWSTRNDADSNRSDVKVNNAKFRLHPEAEINANWKVKARLQGIWSPAKDETGDMALKYIYADGKYGNFSTQLGKQPLYSTSDEGMIFDGMFSGAQVTFGNKLQTILTAGRINLADLGYDLTGSWRDEHGQNDTASYQGLQFVYGLDKLTAGAGYHHVESGNFYAAPAYAKNSAKDKADIWTAGGRYAFDSNASLAGYYGENTKADAYEKAGSVEFDYKGAQAENKGTWGAFLAYRHLGNNVSLSPTYDDMWEGMKGYSFGASYTPFKNIVAYASYTDGTDLLSGKDSNILFGRVKLVW